MITHDMYRMLITMLFLLVILLLLLMIYKGIYGMARVYNWNGKRYRYIGYAPVKKENDAFALYLGERMVDLSRTTAYQIVLSAAFCKRNRYRKLFVYAEGERSYLVVDRDAMKTEIPF